MKYFEEFPQLKKEVAPGIPGFDMNAPFSPLPVKGDVGLEFEVEATNALPREHQQINLCIPDPVTGAVWESKEDHSLRNGREYVTTTAVSVDHVPTAVLGLYSAWASFSTKLKLSNRCSTHVHLNASTWKINKIISAFVLWSVFETALIEWCGPRRKTNHFCLSIEDSPYVVDCLSHFLKTGEWVLPDGTKYTAFNLRRLYDIGTLEIRCGDAWADPEKAIMWIKFLVGFKNFAESLENPAVIPALISGETPRGLLATICESAGVPQFFEEVVGKFDSSSESFDRACYRTFRETIHLCYFPWDDWLPLINKERIVNPFAATKKKIPLRAGDRENLRGIDWRAEAPARMNFDELRNPIGE